MKDVDESGADNGGGNDKRSEPGSYEGETTTIAYNVRVKRTYQKSEREYYAWEEYKVTWVWHAGTKENDFRDIGWMTESDYQALVYSKVYEKTKFTKCSLPFTSQWAETPDLNDLGFKLDSFRDASAFVPAYKAAVEAIKAPQASRSQGLHEESILLMVPVELGYGVLRGGFALMSREAAKWWGSRVIGSAQSTGTRGHAFFQI